MKTQKTSQSRRSSRPSRRVTAKRSSLKVARKQHRASYPIHKRLMLHPLGLFVMLCVGVFMTGWTYQAVADSIISSTIEAPPLQSGATIDSPSFSQSFSSPATTVTGDCPTDSYVTLGINDAFHGAAWCVNDSYNLQTSLYSGTNTLQVQAYNVTDQAGPSTPSVDVTYTPPATATTSTRSSSSSSGSATASSQPIVNATPLVLSSDFNFHTFSAEKQFSWSVDLEGGTPPYNVNVDWGDGNHSTYKFPGDPVFTIMHTFKDGGYYPIVITSTDRNAQTHIMQLAAMITDKNGKAAFLSSALGGTSSGLGAAGGSTNVTSSDSGAAGGSPHHLFGPVNSVGYKWLLVAWPFYIIVLLMTVSFWLGEQREFALIGLRSHKRLARR